jgi:RimJ/RimL family protein N-acetyltransferase
MEIVPARLVAGALVLRRFEASDVAALAAALVASRARLERTLPRLAEQADSAAELVRWMGERFDLGRAWHFGIFDGEGALLGGASIEPNGRNGVELGYWLDVAHHGRGHATTALAYVTRLCLETLGHAEAHIVSRTDNFASAWVARRLGFRCAQVTEGEQRWVMTHAEFPRSAAGERSAAFPEGEDWDRLSAVAARRFALVRRRRDGFRLVWRFRDATGGLYRKAVDVRRVARHASPWVEILACVARPVRWPAHRSLGRCATLASALTEVEGGLYARAVLPLPRLTFEVFARTMEIVAYEATLLRVELARPSARANIFGELYA